MKRLLHINIFLLFFRLSSGCGISKISSEKLCVDTSHAASRDRLFIDNKSPSPASQNFESSE